MADQQGRFLPKLDCPLAQRGRSWEPPRTVRPPKQVSARTCCWISLRASSVSAIRRGEKLAMLLVNVPRILRERWGPAVDDDRRFHDIHEFLPPATLRSAHLARTVAVPRRTDIAAP